MLTFDITVAAHAFAELGGVIAGFSFAALVFLVERLLAPKSDRERENSARKAIVFLILTFYGNILVAVSWGLISGLTDAATNNLLIMALFSSLNFALAAVMTIHSIGFLISATGAQGIIPIFRLVYLVSALIAILFVSMSSTTLMAIQTQLSLRDIALQHPYFFPFHIALTFGPILAGICINLRTPEIYKVTDRPFRVFAHIWIFAMLLSAFAFGYIYFLETKGYLPGEAILGCVTAWALLIARGTVFLPREFSELQESAIKNPQRIKGNTKTKVYHLPGGYYYTRLNSNNTIYFDSEQEAIDAGYRKSRQ